jgi:hypothetical protein
MTEVGMSQGKRSLSVSRRAYPGFGAAKNCGGTKSKVEKNVTSK